MQGMDWLEAPSENCSLQRALEVLGEKWTLLILRDAFSGIRRFDDFHRHLGASEPVLAGRLKKLVAAGLLATRPYHADGQRTRHEYLLTEKALDLFPAIAALMQWGDKYLADEAGGSILVLHKDCGHPVRTVVQCTHDHEVLGVRDTRAVPGPGARKRTG